ncbi:MAG: hypothetical protein KAQ68_09430 [Clostridiales bacterium]|nr:hypothetical protein [Clostridiales bacterium]
MFKRIFANRYGIDQLSIFLMILSIGFAFSRYLWFIGIGIVAYALFRAYSKNFSRRQMELQKYYNFMIKLNMTFKRIFGPITTKIKGFINKSKQRKHYKYIKCRYCSKQLRLPKNKGKIKVTCPECKNEFITKT